MFGTTATATVHLNGFFLSDYMRDLRPTAHKSHFVLSQIITGVYAAQWRSQKF